MVANGTERSATRDIAKAQQDLAPVVDGDLAWTLETLGLFSVSVRMHVDPQAMSELLAERFAVLVGAIDAALGLKRQTLEVVATAESVARLARDDLEEGDGPLSEAVRSASPIEGVVLDSQCPWSKFARRAGRLGYRSVEVVPMRWAGGTAGVVALLHRSPLLLGPAALRLLQSLADIAAFSLVKLDELQRYERRVSQLEHALGSRIRIEQAKGLLAEHLGIDVSSAFEIMRQYSRNRNFPIDELAERLLSRKLRVDELLGGSKRERGRPAS